MATGSTPAPSPVLQARDIHKSYGRHPVLRGADLTVAPGQLVAVVGENGAGKSTLLKVLAGTLPVDRGEVTLSGALGYCPQDPVLNANLTVEQHLRYFAAAQLQTDEDAALIVDRYHTPDIVEIADGHRIDRDKLIAHARPVRKNRPAIRMEVHEAVADGDRIAARYTLHSSQRGRDLATEVYFFGRFCPDGRMRQAHMTTRTVPVNG